jgi:multicomponent Na+:H+ antiporter subunit C
MPPGAGVLTAVLLFGIGVFAMILRRDLVVKLLALGLVNGSTILCLVSLDAGLDAAPPLLGPGTTVAMVDPLPQALVLSAIAINFAILSLALVFVMRLVERYHTTDAQRIDHETQREEE